MNYDRVILELLDKVSALEEEVKSLKQGLWELQEHKETEPVRNSRTKKEIIDKRFGKTVGRDSTKYILDGKKYGKNRFVLAVVKKYADKNPGISAESLMQVFAKEYQGSLGVCRLLSEVQKKYNEKEWKIRFFTDPDEIIPTATGDVVVCTQWGVGNIDRFLYLVDELGIPYDKIE